MNSISTKYKSAKHNKKQSRYLDLTSLRPGDVILTSEKTYVSRLLVFAQRLLHFNFKSPGFSHATLVVNHTLTFDTRFESGARFRTLPPVKISNKNGTIKVWHEITQYNNFAVIRYSCDSIPVAEIFDAALIENTRKYSKPTGFIGLISPKIKNIVRKIKSNAFTREHQEKFCSSLTNELLKTATKQDFFPNNTSNEISPFKLYKSDKIVQGIEQRLPDEYFDESPIAKTLLLHVLAITGHASERNPDATQHAFEDIMNVVSQGHLLKQMIKNDPSLQISHNGKLVSMIDSPNLAQLETLKSKIELSETFFDRLRQMTKCFLSCKRQCNSSFYCMNDIDKNMQEIASTLASQNSPCANTSTIQNQTNTSAVHVI